MTTLTSADGTYTADTSRMDKPAEGEFMYPDIEIRNIKNWVANLPGVVGQSVQPVRNTVISGKVTKQAVQFQPINLPSFLTAGSGFTLNILATATALMVTYAAGNTALGNVDYGHTITADSTVTLNQTSNNYIYTQRDPVAGTQSYGVDYIPPQYEYDGIGICPPALLHFDNDFTNAYGGPAWTNANVAFNASSKFGTYAAYFNGTSAYIENPKPDQLNKYARWSKDFWFKLGSSSQVSQALYYSGGTNSANGFFLVYNYGGADNKFSVYISSTGTTWDLASNLKSTLTLTDTTSFHHCAIEFDGSAYKVYIDGVVWITVTSTLTIPYITRELLGAYTTGAGVAPSNFFNGYIDEYRSSCKPRFLGAFTPPIAAYSPDENYCVFDIANMVMRQFGANAATVQRVYLGEAVTNATSIVSINAYSFQGKSRVLLQSPTSATFVANTQYVVNHGAGAKYVKSKVIAVWKVYTTVSASFILPGDVTALSHMSTSGSYMRPMGVGGRDALRGIVGCDSNGAGPCDTPNWFNIIGVTPQNYDIFADIERAF